MKNSHLIIIFFAGIVIGAIGAWLLFPKERVGLPQWQIATFVKEDQIATIAFEPQQAIVVLPDRRVFPLVRALDSSDMNDNSIPLRYVSDAFEVILRTQEIVIFENGKQIFSALSTSSKGNEVDAQLLAEWYWIRTESEGVTLLPQKPGLFTLVLNKSGSVTGTTDCNNFSGNYSQSKNKIIFSKLAMTKKYCEGSQENEFIQPLSEMQNYQITENGNSLILLSKNKKIFFERGEDLKQ